MEVITKKIHLHTLFDHINQQHESINFSTEEEGADGTLPMLDIRMIREGENITMEWSYMQTTTYSGLHIIQYLKLSVPSLLFYRCESVITDKEQRKEK